MDIIKIVTKGEISFPAMQETTAGYRYDIPFDNVSLPSLPISEAIREQVSLPEGTIIGRAHPAGYLGLIGYASKMLNIIPNCEHFIRAYYTKDRFDHQRGYSIRSVKRGNVFEARISFPKEAGEVIQKALQKITHIGISITGINGEVSMTLEEREIKQDKGTMSDLCNYSSLQYNLMLLSSACFYEPYQSGSTTSLYIPGSAVRKALKQSGFDCSTFLRCSNAYMSDGKSRFLPTPLCSSLVKLDNRQLRYRMSLGKDPNRVEQDISMEGTFTDSIDKHLVSYGTPEIERIIPADGKPVDALQSGQLFSGILYGSDEAIRSVARHIKNNPILNFGDMCDEGFGEAICMVERICEDEISAPIMAKRFDLCCASDVLLISDNGMPSYHAENLLKEAELVLGVQNKLKIISKYTGIRRDYSKNPEGGWDRDVKRCLKMGSVIRVETVDGSTIDISPLLHTFIGERTDEGYGEIIAYPAKECYYRLAENVGAYMYIMNNVKTSRDIAIGSLFVSTVMKNILKARVERFAILDREEYRRGINAEELLPMDLLNMLKENFYPAASDEELKEWYLKYLKENEDESD
ncbi:MAG: hypothetical protein IJP56_03160 [Synergistaceae bacterium]|nr:hypothetical protein [Synergistaceae bacterium]